MATLDVQGKAIFVNMKHLPKSATKNVKLRLTVGRLYWVTLKQGNNYLQFSLRRFYVVFPPNLAPRPLQTGQARKMVQKVPKISTGDRFQCHSVTCFCSITKTTIRNPCISATHKIIYSYRGSGPPRIPLPGTGIEPQRPGTGSPGHPGHVPDRQIIYSSNDQLSQRDPN